MNFIFEPSLVLYLPLYRLDGASFASRDAYGHLCTVSGALWRPYGHYFDGVDDKIDCGTPATLNFGAGSYTVGAWFYYTLAANDKPLFNSTDSSNRRRINLRSSAFSRHAIGGSIQERTFTRPDAEVWHLLVGVYSLEASKLLVYIDGCYEDETTGVTGTLADTTVNEVGVWTALGFKFGGLIGEVWIYSRVLTPLEIQHNYLATKWRYR